MLKERILTTLKFFNLQDTPLTLFELHKYLINDLESLRLLLGQDWEVKNIRFPNYRKKIVNMYEVLECLEKCCAGETVCLQGYYALKGREEIIENRLKNYYFGIKREKRIKKFLPFIKFLPFVRGAAILGSQALGQQKKSSDIDLLIIVEPDFMWLSRLFVTAYFQIIWLRRHGKKIASRFCLNHYLAGPKTLNLDRNLYTAVEYLKLRPVVGVWNFYVFQRNNLEWVRALFPNTQVTEPEKEQKPLMQRCLEKVFDNFLGKFLNKTVKYFQYNRLNIGEFIVATDTELSFHPNNRKKELFRKFFEFKQ